jgi:CheY-like chemotaxis protein
MIALTGYTEAARRLQTDERVFDCHLTKPLSLDDLADFMRHT